MVSDVDNIYESLELLHKEGKHQRSHLSYLTTREIYNFIKSNRSSKNVAESGRTIFDFSHIFSVALGWKQFQQVYTFHPKLIEELYNIDVHNDKFATISREEIEFLPCFNFYVEQDIMTKNTLYNGFFVYFDEINKTDSYGQIHVLLLKNFDGVPRIPINNLPMYADYYNLTLLYNYDKMKIVESSTGKVYECEVEPIEALRMLNPITFKEMGDDAAMEMLTHITQIITYLCATNADFTRTKKPSKKPDLKRTHITDAESEKWTLGSNFYHDFDRPPQAGVYKRTRYADENEEHEVIYINEPKEITEPTERRKGYHVRPHMRRAHWKYYWYGKKDGSEERVKRRKFVSAVFINAQNEELIVPTIEELNYKYRF